MRQERPDPKKRDKFSGEARKNKTDIKKSVERSSFKEKKPYEKKSWDPGQERKRFPDRPGNEESGRAKRFDKGSAYSEKKKSFSTADKDPNRKRTGTSKPFERSNQPSQKRDGFPYVERKSYGDGKKTFSGKGRSVKPFEKKASSLKREFDRPSKKTFRKPVGELSHHVPETLSQGTIRLNKFIANSGICSRREADVLIETGVISVNDKIVTELGYKISPGDVIKYNGSLIRRESPVYLLLNKPKDYITTMDDPGGRKTVYELIANKCRERIYPVGRLDRASTGVLLFTNDGELTKKLTHPKYGIKKIYQVQLDKPLKKEDMNKIREGIELEDGIIKVDEISYLDDSDKTMIGIEIHSGKNRVIRRIFEALEYEVYKLDRVSFAGLTKKDLPRGRSRFLTEKEVGFLKMISG